MRKQRILAALAALLIAAGSLAGCAAEPAGPQRYQQVFYDVFDTVTIATITATDAETADAWFGRLHELLTEYHRLYDIYHAYDGMENLCTVNANAGAAPVAVDARILDLIDYAKEIDTLTGGRVNVALGAVLSIWSDYRAAGNESPETAELPPAELLAAAAEHTRIDDVIVDRAAGTLYLADAALQLDVGAIAKGYAAQRVVDELRSEGLDSLLLSVGGNVSAIGGRPEGGGWRVSVQDPYSDGSLCVVSITDESLVTSGSYERYYVVDGTRYHHIIDPETLMPSARFDSVTVISADSALADALTTGLFCMPLSEGESLVESLDGVEALWVEPDGTLTYSSGFAANLADSAG